MGLTLRPLGSGLASFLHLRLTSSVHTRNFFDEAPSSFISLPRFRNSGELD